MIDTAFALVQVREPMGGVTVSVAMIEPPTFGCGQVPGLR